MEDVPRFHWADYLVLSLSLSVSLTLGIFYAIKDRKKQSNEEFLMAGRSMSIGPVTASTFATLISCMGFIAYPVEVYYFGLGYMFVPIGAVLALIPTAEYIAPAFHRMNVVSAFQYLETRFNANVRKAASILQLFLTLFMLGMLAYAPAVALAQVSGISVPLGILIVTVVCCIYTVFGGMKAVVFSDTVQMVLMFSGVIALAFKAIFDMGGFKKTFSIVYDGDRVTNFNWNPDPFQRSGAFPYLIGGFTQAWAMLTSTQMAIQRYCTLPTIREVKISVYLMIPMVLFLQGVIILVGLAMYATFAECDPVFGGVITSVDQYVPYLVMKVLGPWPGMPGLYIASIFAASLSSMAGGQNAMGAVFLKDIVEPVYLKCKGVPMKDRTSFFVAKGLVFIVSSMTLLMAFMVLAMGGDLFALVFKFVGALSGPTAGMFTLAILIPYVKDITSVISGFVISSVVCMFISIGGTMYKTAGSFLPISVEGCVAPGNDTMWNSTVTEVYTNNTIFSTMAPVVPDPEPSIPKGLLKLFNLSPLLYAGLGYLLQIIIALIGEAIVRCINKDKPEEEKKVAYSTVPQTPATPINEKEKLDMNPEKQTFENGKTVEEMELLDKLSSV